MKSRIAASKMILGNLLFVYWLKSDNESYIISKSASFDRNNAVSKLIPNLLASFDDCRNFLS